MKHLVPLVSASFLAFLLGFVTYHYRTFPYAFLRDAHNQFGVFLEMQGLSKPHHLFPAVYDRSGARVADVSSMSPGYTLLTSYWKDLDWKAGIKLIDNDGTAVHTWKTEPAEIWKSSLKARMLNYVHGVYLFPNGDIVFNIEFMGLVRMNSCGEIQWILDYTTHHSIYRNEDGNFWVSGNVERNDYDYLKQYPGLREPVYEDHALLVSPEGEILKDINLLDVVYKNNLQRNLPRFSRVRSGGDIFHLNDVESLPKRLADQYPIFEVGDIVVSLKYVNVTTG